MCKIKKKISNITHISINNPGKSRRSAQFTGL